MQTLTEREVDQVAGGFFVAAVDPASFEAIGRFMDDLGSFQFWMRQLDRVSAHQSRTMVPEWRRGNAMAGSIPGP